VVHAQAGRVLDDVVEEAGSGNDLQVVPVDSVQLFFGADLLLEVFTVGEADDRVLQPPDLQAVVSRLEVEPLAYALDL